MKEKIKKLFCNRKFGNIKKSISWILFQNIYTMVLSLIITGIVARHFGTEGYGIINFSASFVSLFAFISIFGTNNIILNDLSEKKEDIGKILGSNLFIRIILALLSLIISQTISIFSYDKVTNIAIFLFNINVFINCSDIISYYAQSKIKNKFISISKIISTTIFSILKLIVVILDFNIIILIFTYLIENIIYTILLIISYKKIKEEDNFKWSVDKNYIKKLLNKSKYFALSSLMVMIYLKIDQVMLGSFFDNKSQVGIYSAAVRISEIWTFVPLAVITSYRPIIVKSKLEDEKAYYKNLQKLYNIISLICLVFVIGIVALGKIGIFILYGNDFVNSYIPLIILTVGIWFGILGNVHYIWMTCNNKEKYSLLYSGIGCIINVILNLLLIPNYGIVGAAIATLISQISSNVISFLFIKKARIISIMLLKSLNPIYCLKNLK